MTGPDIIAVMRVLEERFRQEEGRLNELDSVLGDGDHGATMVRGLAAVTQGLDATERPAGAGAVLTQAAKDFSAATGGASGTLFSSLFREIGVHSDLEVDADSFGRGLCAATERVMRVGKAAPGDKTMVDALVPAEAAVKSQEPRATSLASLLAIAAAAAEDGAAQTIRMAARRGRARYVEDGGRGHVDPGATSVALMLRTLAEEAQRSQ